MQGAIAYDAGRCIEKLPAWVQADIDIPDIFTCAYDAVVAVHHPTRTAWVLATEIPGRGDRARAQAADLAERVRQASNAPARSLEPLQSPVEITSNFSPDAYQRARLKSSLVGSFIGYTYTC